MEFADNVETIGTVPIAIALPCQRPYAQSGFAFSMPGRMGASAPVLCSNQGLSAAD